MKFSFVCKLYFNLVSFSLFLTLAFLCRRIAKVGSSNWKRLLAYTSDNSPLKKITELGEKEVHNFTWQENMSIRPLRNYNLKGEEGKAKLRNFITNYTKAVMVRNPLVRLVSAWNDKLRYADNYYYTKTYGSHIVEKYRNETSDEILANLTTNGPTLEEFFKFIVRNVSNSHNNPNIYDVHCMSFILFLFLI